MRAISYIDGNNLFYGMRDAKLRSCYWLDISSLCMQMLLPGWTLEATKYFTARIRNNPEKEKRQKTYLEAISELGQQRVQNNDLTGGLQIIEGLYRADKSNCPRCRAALTSSHEKKTDVAIATHMLMDVVMDQCDAVILISGDSDLVPPLEAIKEQFKHIKIKVVFPPHRNTTRELIQKSDFNDSLFKRHLERSQLPEKIQRNDGYVYECPDKWK